MKTRKIPLRTCIVTREKLEKRELIRIVKNKEGKIFIDLTSKANGRGVYLKRDIEVVNKAKKNKILDKSLGVEIENNIYDELEKIVSENK